MIGRTVAIPNSSEVLAMFGESGTFYRGRWEKVRVTRIGPDENTPLEIRRSLVGLVVPTIFTKERIEQQTGATFPIPSDSRLAYSSDVVEALQASGRVEASRQLGIESPNPLDMYVFEKGIYELVD